MWYVIDERSGCGSQSVPTLTFLSDLPVLKAWAHFPISLCSFLLLSHFAKFHMKSLPNQPRCASHLQFTAGKKCPGHQTQEITNNNLHRKWRLLISPFRFFFSWQLNALNPFPLLSVAYCNVKKTHHFHYCTAHEILWFSSLERKKRTFWIIHSCIDVYLSYGAQFRTLLLCSFASFMDGASCHLL